MPRSIRLRRLATRLASRRLAAPHPSGRLAAAVVLVLVSGGLGLAGCGGAGAPNDDGPRTGGSTLRATLVDPDGDGVLTRGGPEPLRARTDLAPAAKPGRVLATIGQLTDAHVRDEESPGRAPFLDRFGGSLRSTFRPQEAMSAQVLTAAVRAVNAQRPDAVVLTGDLTDNAQRNELDLARSVLEGGRVNPDSGRSSYRGVQEADNPDPLYYRPDQDAPRHPGSLDAAQRPFASPGLAAPWFALLGNHDVLRQGEVPPAARTDAVATGTRLLTSLAPDFRLPVGGDSGSRRPGGGDADVPVPGEEDASGALDALLNAGIPGKALRVPADPERRAISNAEAVGAWRRGRTLRAPDSLDYTFDVGAQLRGIAIDTVDRTGGATGVLTRAQVAWLRARLAQAASDGRDAIVFSHNRLDSLVDPEPALAVLARSPALIANVAGNTHRSRVRPVQTAQGGYWVIETSSLADFPQQGRMLQVRERAGGGRVIETWMVDQDGRALAGVARDLAYLDAQGGRPLDLAGTVRDRNVRLELPARR